MAVVLQTTNCNMQTVIPAPHKEDNPPTSTPEPLVIRMCRPRTMQGCRLGTIRLHDQVKLYNRAVLIGLKV